MKDCTKNQKKNKKGFSLIEILVALFVFSVLLVSVTIIYAEFFNVQRKTKGLQRNVEGMQSNLNLVVKTARTSDLISSSETYVLLYDYSRSKYGDATQKDSCIRFELKDETLVMTSAADVSKDECSAEIDSGDKVNLTNPSVFKVYGEFFAKQPLAGISAGLVVASFQTCDARDLACGASSPSAQRLQGAASLR